MKSGSDACVFSHSLWFVCELVRLRNGKKRLLFLLGDPPTSKIALPISNPLGQTTGGQADE